MTFSKDDPVTTPMQMHCHVSHANMTLLTLQKVEYSVFHMLMSCLFQQKTLQKRQEMTQSFPKFLIWHCQAGRSFCQIQTLNHSIWERISCLQAMDVLSGGQGSLYHQSSDRDCYLMYVMDIHEWRPYTNVARSFLWWPGLDQEIENFVGQCAACEITLNRPAVAPLHPWSWATSPWERIHVDFAEINKQHYLLVEDVY